MLKQNVFLVAGRECDGDGVPRGEIVQYVICSATQDSVIALIAQRAPTFSVLSVTSLVMLEERVKKIKSVLAGTDKTWVALIDPLLQAGQEN